MYIEHTLIADNVSTSGSGGGIAQFSGKLVLVSCTVADNTASAYGGGFFGGRVADPDPQLLDCWMYNTLLWGNTAAGQAQQIHHVGDTLLWACDVEDGEEGIFSGEDVLPEPVQDNMIWATNCIEGDPQFVDPGGSNPDPEDDYALNPNSACVDAGDTGTIPEDSPDLDGDGVFDEPIPFDLKGQARINRCAVDIGAYEAQVPPLNPPVWDAQDPNLGPKNRYFSFVHDQNPAVQTAVRVTFAEPPSEYWDDLEGRVLWVGEPVEITEASGSDGPEPPPKFWGATLQCVPFYTDWSVYDRVDVYDDAIIPGSMFELDTILSAPECKVTEPYGYSEPVAISTVDVWGDVVGDCGVTPCTVPDGVVDFEDITAVVEKFQSDPDAPIKSRADLINSNVTDPEPDRKVDFVDVSFCVDAFRGFEENPNSYPGPNLGDFDCPPYGDCYADIGVDSDNDGDIDDFDNGIEESAAASLPFNNDDDNENGTQDTHEAPVVGEDDLIEVRLNTPCDPPIPELAWWCLGWSPDPTPAVIRFWVYPDKSAEGDGIAAGEGLINCTTGEHYDWPPPPAVWAEGLEPTGEEFEITFTIYDPEADKNWTSFVGQEKSDRGKVKIPECTPSPLDEKRWWVGGKKDFALGQPNIITKAEARIPTRSVQPLCGEQIQQQFLYETVSAVFVSVAFEQNLLPDLDVALFAEIGYLRRREKYAKQAQQGVFFELLSGENKDDYQFKLRPELLSGGTHHYVVQHVGPLPMYPTGTWRYMLDNDEIGRFQDEIWSRDVLESLIPHSHWEISWNGEVTHAQDKLAGIANSRCTFTECQYQTNWSTVHPAGLTTNDVDYFPRGDPRHPGANAFGKEFKSATSFEIWDKDPS